MSDHPTSRRAKAKRQDADRSQKHRDKCKEGGVPTTHVLNRALAEGFFYEFAKQRADGASTKEIKVSAQAVFAYAMSILTSQTNGTSQYDPEQTLAAIRGRVQRECTTPFRIEFLPNHARRGATDNN